jgi:hypothetical protein
MALPALIVQNWNSGAIGMMRYVFWSAMPLVYALLYLLHQSARWPTTLLLIVALIQTTCMVSARSYPFWEFSLLAAWLMEHAPGLYNPETEIFFVRLQHSGHAPDPSSVYSYSSHGIPVKTMYHQSNSEIDLHLCGKGLILSSDTHVAETDHLWRYINGPVQCIPKMDYPNR